LKKQHCYTFEHATAIDRVHGWQAAIKHNSADSILLSKLIMTYQEQQSRTSNNAQSETERRGMMSAAAAMANKNNTGGDASSSMMGDGEQQMELIEMLNQEGLSLLEKASHDIDLMLNPFHSSTSSPGGAATCVRRSYTLVTLRSSAIEKELETAFDIFKRVADQRMRVTGRAALAQDYYNLACVHSLLAELSMVGRSSVSSSPTTLMFGQQECIDGRLEEAEELLMLAEAAGYDDPERSIQKDRKLRVLRAASSIHNATQCPPQPDDTAMSQYKPILVLTPTMPGSGWGQGIQIDD
jgi:hypothetical protein